MSTERTSSSGSVHKHPVVLLRIRARHKRRIRRRERDVQSRRLVHTHRRRDLEQSPPVDLDLLGVGALAGAEDARLAWDEVAAFGNGGVGGDDAGELDAAAGMGANEFVLCPVERLVSSTHAIQGNGGLFWYLPCTCKTVENEEALGQAGRSKSVPVRTVEDCAFKQGQRARSASDALVRRKPSLTVQPCVMHIHQDLVLARLRFLPLDQPRRQLLRLDVLLDDVCLPASPCIVSKPSGGAQGC